jgi:predicted O-methyltransferase YrrM
MIEYTVENGIAFTIVNGTRGTLNKRDSETLIECAKALGPNSRYIETGSYLGCSALLVSMHTDPTTTVWSHDIWVTDWNELKGEPPPEVSNYFYEFYDMVKKNSMINKIIPIRGNSVYTLGIHDDKSVHLAFIDGDHTYEGCMGDLKAVLPKMAPGSTILVHDAVPGSEPLKAVENFGLEFTIVPGSWGMAKILIA